MSRLVFDIETAGFPFDALDESQQEYLLHFARGEDEKEAEKLKTSLYPYTAEVVCIGMLNVDSGEARVHIQAPEGTEEWTSEDGKTVFVPGSEVQVLTRFWEAVPRYQQVISFNGRGFDGPFLHVRSAVLGIPSTRNLVPYRYDFSNHCDLMDQLSFYGGYRKFSLDFVCKGFGIESPKGQGVTGLEVADLHREGRYREIAEYNHRDLIATCMLYRKWFDTIRPAMLKER